MKKFIFITLVATIIVGCPSKKSEQEFLVGNFSKPSPSIICNDKQYWKPVKLVSRRADGPRLGLDSILKDSLLLCQVDVKLRLLENNNGYLYDQSCSTFKHYYYDYNTEKGVEIDSIAYYNKTDIVDFKWFTLNDTIFIYKPNEYISVTYTRNIPFHFIKKGDTLVQFYNPGFYQRYFVKHEE